MEFMNVGGGELLIIILLALVLFSPEDILKLMRTIGNYARTARQMWSNVSKSLQDDYIPDEVKEVVKETASSVKDVKDTLTGVREKVDDITTSVEEEVSDATVLADSEISDAVSVVNETQITAEIEDSASEDEVTFETEETPIDPDIDTVEESILPQKKMTTEEIIESILHPPTAQIHPTEDLTNDQEPDSSSSDNQLAELNTDAQSMQEEEATVSLTKEITTKTQDFKEPVNATAVNAKLIKVTEDSLKDDGNGS